MADRFLTAAIIDIFRGRSSPTVVPPKCANISQLTAYLKDDPKWRNVGTQEVRQIVFSLEKDKLLVREVAEGIGTRFRWYNRHEAVVTPGANLR